ARVVPAQLRLRPAPPARDPRGAPAGDAADARRGGLDEPEPDDRGSDPRRDPRRARELSDGRTGVAGPPGRFRYFPSVNVSLLLLPSCPPTGTECTTPRMPAYEPVPPTIAMLLVSSFAGIVAAAISSPPASRNAPWHWVSPPFPPETTLHEAPSQPTCL